MPQVSVLLTSYNHAPFLTEAIDSVLAQSFKDFELIIWDDHSTDDSWDIIQSYADPRIKAFQNPVNMGPVFGVNKAIFEVASSEYFAMHHSDDVWVKDKLEKQLACFAQNPNVAAVFTDAQAIAEEGFHLDDDDHFYSRAFQQPNRTRHQWLRHFLLHGNALCHPSVLIRRSVYTECGGYSEALWQLPDFDMWVRLLLKHEIHVMPEKLVKFRVLNAEANTSGNRPDSRMQWMFEFPHVLNHYRSVTDINELLQILPEAIEYDRGPDTSISFALARTVLKLSQMPAVEVFGFNLLFEQLRNPITCEHIRRVYDFGPIQFSRFTSMERVIAKQSLQLVNEALQEKIKYYEWYVPIIEQKYADLKVALEGLYKSISWRLSKPVRMVGGMLRYPKLLKAKINALPESQIKHGFLSPLQNAYAVYKQEQHAALVKERAKATLAINPGVGSGEHDRYDYKAWVARYDTLTDAKRAELTAKMEGFGQRPLISVIMPTYQPNPNWLAEAVDSVRNQIYPNWELCIADDASPNPEVKAQLQALEALDTRIRVIYREQNGHISAATNSALGLARGDWIALLDHDDILTADALFWVAESINQHPDAGVIYSDEDKINDRGERFDPYFKSDWNPDLFRSQNMISHLGVYRRSLVSAVNGFRTGFEGAQDYDLALRVTEQLAAAQIVHIPRILYHWRAHEGSTAHSAEAKDYALDAGVRAIKEHLSRQGLQADVEMTMGIQYRVRYQLPACPPLVSLIIPTRNAHALVKQCIDSILSKTTYPNYEILLIDNASDDPPALEYFATLAEHPKIRVIRDERPFNYSALNNSAVARAKGEVIALINNDIEVITPDWLEEMVSFALLPDVGAVGARLWYPDDTLQHGGVIMGLGVVAGHAHKHFRRQPTGESASAGLFGYCGRAGLIQSFSAVTAACLVVQKARYVAVGGLDEKYLSIAYNDVDFCLKLQEVGFRNIWTPHAELYHHESATRGKEDTLEKQERAAREISYMQRRWRKIITRDPAYSPNLTTYHEDFSLAWPPRV